MDVFVVMKKTSSGNRVVYAGVSKYLAKTVYDSLPKESRICQQWDGSTDHYYQWNDFGIFPDRVKVKEQ